MFESCWARQMTEARREIIASGLLDFGPSSSTESRGPRSRLGVRRRVSVLPGVVGERPSTSVPTAAKAPQHRRRPLRP